MLPKFLVQRFATAFGNEYNVVFALHLLWLKLSYSSIRDLLLVCLAAHDLEFLGWSVLQKCTDEGVNMT